MLQKFLNPQEIQAINRGVSAAEKKTAGEIKVLVVKSSASFKGKTGKHKTETRANYEFFELGLDHTRDNTGILIMISLAERRVVVRASETINEFYDKETWQAIVDTVIEGIKNNDPASGICSAIEKCGIILSRRFPIKSDDVNEISDEIVFKE